MRGGVGQSLSLVREHLTVVEVPAAITLLGLARETLGSKALQAKSTHNSWQQHFTSFGMSLAVAAAVAFCTSQKS